MCVVAREEKSETVPMLDGFASAQFFGVSSFNYLWY